MLITTERLSSLACGNSGSVPKSISADELVLIAKELLNYRRCVRQPLVWQYRQILHDDHWSMWLGISENCFSNYLREWHGCSGHFDGANAEIRMLFSTADIEE